MSMTNKKVCFVSFILFCCQSSLQIHSLFIVICYMNAILWHRHKHTPFDWGRRGMHYLGSLSGLFPTHPPPLAPSLLTHFLTHYCVLLMQLRTNLCMYVYVCIAHRNIINLYWKCSIVCLLVCGRSLAVKPTKSMAPLHQLLLLFTLLQHTGGIWCTRL